MIDSRKKNVSKYVFGLFFIFFFVLIFVLNRMYPIHSDDWMYSFVFYEKPVRFIGNISDIIVSQYNHYFYWGGRNVVHFIDQLLLFISPSVREIINSLAFVAFILMIYKISKTKNTIQPTLFLFIGLLSWMGLPTFPQTVVWITGSANYLWGTLIVLYFMSFYIAYLKTEKASDSTIKRIFFLIGGIIAGWTNENLVVALIFSILVIFCFYRLMLIRIPVWAIIGFIGVCIGCIIMLAAPGNFIRSHDTNIALGLEGKPFFDVLKFKARNIYFIYKYIPSVGALIIGYVLSFFVYWFATKSYRDIKVLFISVLFFVSAQVSALAMIASPIFPVRASFCLHAFMIVAISVLYGALIFDTKCKRIANYLLLSVLFVCFVYVYKSIYIPTSYLYERYNAREAYIEDQKKQGNKDVILYETAIILPGQFDFEDITDDNTSWRNSICADYYELNSIKRTENITNQ